MSMTMPRPAATSSRAIQCSVEFVAHTVDGDVVVRTYARDPERAGVDASLLRLVRGLLPVAAVSYTRPQ